MNTPKILLYLYIAAAALSGQIISSNSNGTGYSSLQAAVNAAVDGDMVLLLSNTAESVIVQGKTNLTIAGYNAVPVLSGSGSGVGLLISNCQSLTIEKIALTAFSAAVYITNAESVLLRYSLFSNNQTGISNDGGLSTAVYNNFSNNTAFTIISFIDSPDIKSNYFDARLYSQKKISGTFTAVSPWLNGPLAITNDTVIPDVVSGIGAADGSATNECVVSWNQLADGDISNYRLFRTTNNTVSNISASDLICEVIHPAQTYTDTIVSNGIYYYYVTGADTNGNESWYPSPVSFIKNGLLSLSITAGVTLGRPFDTITYTIVYTNIGNGVIPENLHIDQMLPNCLNIIPDSAETNNTVHAGTVSVTYATNAGNWQSAIYDNGSAADQIQYIRWTFSNAVAPRSAGNVKYSVQIR